MVILILSLSHWTISIEIVDHFEGKQIKLFMTCVICRCVYSILGIYSLDTRRWVLPPRSLHNFRPSGTYDISVPGIVQDVPLHKRFPYWGWPVISFLVHNIMWRCGVPHNMQCLRGLTMSRVSTHPPTQPSCDVLQHPKRFSLMVRSKKKKRAFCNPAPGVIWIFEVQRDSA